MSLNIVIEGLDGTGKETQSKLLYNNLLQKYDKENIRRVSFPDYELPSGLLIQSYLNGTLSNTFNYDEDKWIYFISSIYTLNRLEMFQCKRKDEDENLFKFVENPSNILIMDRYTTSNALHQGSKFDSIEKLDEYIEWLQTHEYKECLLPKPTITFFLDLPLEVVIENITNRHNSKHDGNDIHETIEHIQKVYKNRLYIAEKMGWIFIDCYDKVNKCMKSREDINRNIQNVLYAVIEDYIKQIEGGENNG